MLLGIKQARGSAKAWTPCHPVSAFFCATVVIALFLMVGFSLTSSSEARILPAGSFELSQAEKPEQVPWSVLHPQHNETDAVTSVEPVKRHWVASWTAASQACQPDNDALFSSSFYANGVALHKSTIRQTVRLTLGADTIRVRLSNTFSSTPLTIDEAVVALPEPEIVGNTLTSAGSPGIVSTTLKALTFGGHRHTTIPKGGQVLSDPVNITVLNGEILSISLYLGDGQDGDVLTCHAISRVHSWIAIGNQINAPTFSRRGAESPARWYFISAVEAWKTDDHHAVVVLGDSITDSSQSTTDRNARWVDHLFDRLQNSSDPALQKLSIVNEAIGGNQLLEDRTSPNLNARLDRDALTISGVKFAVLVYGVIDMGAGRDATQAFLQLQQAIERLHLLNIAVFGVTLHPFSCQYGKSPWAASNSPHSETQRLKLNDMIRNENLYDVLQDWDEILRDPQNVTEARPEFRSDDCLHPAHAGFDAIVAAFPVEGFGKFQHGITMDDPAP